MTPIATLAHLRAAGLVLEFSDIHLLVSPAEAVTPALASLIRAHRDELVTLLHHEAKAAEARELSRQLEDFSPAAMPPALREWLTVDGIVVADTASDPREWPPPEACWERKAGGPWLPIQGRLPLCQQFPANLPYGCWMASQGRQCQGCRLAGAAG